MKNERPSDEDPLLTSTDWSRLRDWYDSNGRHDLPWRRNRAPWATLVAEVLLHRTRAELARMIFPVLLEEFPAPAVVVKNEQEWLEQMKPAGLEWRAKLFIEASRILVSDFEGEVPPAREDLMSLPGVGHYIAAAVRCFGFGLSEVLVDTNTIRLASRVSGVEVEPGHHRSGIVTNLVARLGEGGTSSGAKDNYALLDLAAAICVSESPKCPRCPLLPSCVTGKSRTEDESIGSEV